jgi:hypothetical protein
MAHAGASSTVLEYSCTHVFPPFTTSHHIVLHTKQNQNLLQLHRSNPHRYACESTQDFVDRHAPPPPPPRITSFASAHTALQLSRAALARSVHLMTTQCCDAASLAGLKGACGVGATACLVSKSWKRGDHRLFVALSDCDNDFAVSVNLHKVNNATNTICFASHNAAGQ